MVAFKIQQQIQLWKILAMERPYGSTSISQGLFYTASEIHTTNLELVDEGFMLQPADITKSLLLDASSWRGHERRVTDVKHIPFFPSP